MIGWKTIYRECPTCHEEKWRAIVTLPDGKLTSVWVCLCCQPAIRRLLEEDQRKEAERLARLERLVRLRRLTP